MNHRKLNFIKCKCGRNISIRTLIRHLKVTTANRHSEEFKNRCIELINKSKKDRGAWKISDGENGLRDDFWCAKVLNDEIKIEELTFLSPRPVGRMTLESRKKMSKERMGRKNPSLKNKPIYSIEEIKKCSIVLFDQLLQDPEKFKKLEFYLKNEFPEYKYSFAGLFPYHGGKRGYNRSNSILAFLLDRSIDCIIEEKAKDRGIFISKGQIKSPNFNKIQNANRKGLKGYTSLAHRVLYNMVLSLDKKSKMEKQIDYGTTWKSYDIVSPSLNILFEMHGRIWHDLTKCKPKMENLVKKNVENDEIKKHLAKDSGYPLYIFWDDEVDKWESKLKDIYGKEPKSYEKALREEIIRKEKLRSV